MSSTETTVTLRIQSREGTKRVNIDDSNPTVAQLKSSIQTELGIPVQNQTLSTHRKLLEAKTHEDLLKFTDMSNPNSSLSDLKLSHGSDVYLLDNSSVGPKMIVDNHNQKGYCSGTESSFNSKGSQNYEGAIINCGENAGSYGGSGSAGVSKQQHGGGGTRNSFNCESGSQHFPRAKINSGQNSGNHSGSGSEAASEQQHGGGSSGT